MEILNDDVDSNEFIPFTKTERIHQLNDVDESLNRLLTSAGLSIQTLSATKIPNNTSKLDRQHRFEENCNSFLRTLQTIDVALHRQIYGLEEANIILADKNKKEEIVENSFKGSFLLNRPSKEKNSMKNETIEKDDIRLLDSQSWRVGRDIEAELWKRARTLLEEVGDEIISTKLQ